MPSRGWPWPDFFVWGIIKRKRWCLNTLQKNTSLGNKNVESLQGYISKMMTEVFPLSQNLSYNIRQQSDFSWRSVESVYHSRKSLGYLFRSTKTQGDVLLILKYENCSFVTGICSAIIESGSTKIVERNFILEKS